MTKAVIFDMDGVLVDNRELHMEAFRIWCSQSGNAIDENILVSVFGMGNRDIFPAILGRPVEESLVRRYGEQKEEIYRQIARNTIQPLRGLPQFLETLRQKGILMAVGSSGIRKNVDMVLQMLRIKGYFSAIVDGDQLHRAKPDPEVYIKCASELGVKPSQCIVCEDAPAGIKAARDAGMKVVAITSTLPREQHTDYDILVDNFVELLSDIDRVII